MIVGGGLTLYLGCIMPVIALVICLGLVVECIIGVIFWPIVIICHIFGCGGSGGGAQVDGDQVVSVTQSDGHGALEPNSVPADLRDAIRQAGEECGEIGAIVIAAQIQQESGFNKNMKGPGGREGISQMPPDKFKEFGKDDDDNGETSAMDPEDSIRAQGRYMCSLSDDIDTLIANNEVSGDRLDLTLAAYHLGLDAVKQAKGVPDDDEAQGYVIGVRSGFAMFSGAIKPPSGQPYPTITPPDYGSQ